MDGPTTGSSARQKETDGEKPRTTFPAFKEWAIVCASIERGETSLIFRKGGIAEGVKGFQFKHRRFFLFPTYFHEQIGRTRLGAERDLTPPNDCVAISVLAEIEFAGLLDDLTQVNGLEPFHVLQPSVLEERFHYDQPAGLHVAFLRAFRLSPVWKLSFHSSFRGCRSWITLPEPPSELKMQPILSDVEQRRRQALCLARIKSHVD
jgi:hypothetical protein